MKMTKIRHIFAVCFFYLILSHSIFVYALERHVVAVKSNPVSIMNCFIHSLGYILEMFIAGSLGFLLCSIIKNQESISEKSIPQRKIKKQKKHEEQYKFALLQAGFKVFEFNKEDGNVIQSSIKLGCYGFDTLNGTPESYIKRGIVHAEDAENFKKIFHDIKIGNKPINCMVRLKENEVYKWYRIMLINIFSENLAIGIVEDISNINKMIVSYSTEGKYHTSIKKMYPYCFEVNISKNYFYNNSEFFLLNYFFPINSNMEEVLLNFSKTQVHLEDISIFNEFFQRNKLIEAFFNNHTQFDIEVRLKNQENQYAWWNFHMFLYNNEIEDVCGLVFLKDIDMQKQNTLMLQRHAERDLFTGLYNKATTQTLISNLLQQDNEKEQFHGIMVLDIDDFKIINDTMGHITGDLVLTKIASDMKEIFRKTDIIGRTGGDEFMVFIRDISGIKNVTDKSEEILKKIRSYDFHMENGIDTEISVSIGIALYPQHGITFQELYQRADEALYHSKRSGKNQYYVYGDNDD